MVQKIKTRLTEYDLLVAKMMNEFPKFELIQKQNSTLMKIIDVCMKVITFGSMNTYMTNFTTTIGYKVYTPTLWDRMDQIGILKHERIHMLQAKKHGLWFMFSYLFLWFPTVFAYYRKKYEQEAYAESMRYDAQVCGIEWICDELYKDNIVKHFTSPQYFWTWPFRKSIEKWYDKTVEEIRSELDITPVNIYLKIEHE